MPGYEIVSATPDHVLELAENMRQADVDECWAAGRLRPFQAVSMSVLASRDTKVGLVDGRVACMWGVATVAFTDDSGQPWLLATDLLRRHKKSFLHESKVWMDAYKARYNLLVNVVDDRNKDAIRWIKWLGFDLGEPMAYGPDRMPFRRFIWERKHVDSSESRY